MAMRQIRWAVALLLALCVFRTSVAKAQIPVIDAFNLIQTAQTAINTYEAYRALIREYEVLVTMARRHPNMARYLTPDVPIILHDAARYPSGAPLLQALNAGDPAGDRYFQVVRPVDRLESIASPLDAEARAMLQRAYATIDIADSAASMAAHQVGHVRVFGRNAANAIAAVERDTLGGSDDLHQETAVLDRINAAQVVARRQDAVTNQLLSHLVEQWLVANKRQRDAETVLMNMRINDLRYYRAYAASFFTDAADVQAQSWRQP
jgi:hypothetical protein